MRDDNRWSNQRLATGSQQRANTGPPATNSSGLKGVQWYGPRQKYVAKIKFGQKLFHLGYFHTARDAARAYDIAAASIFGEFCYLNFPADLPHSILLSDCRLTARAWRHISTARQRAVESLEAAA